MDRELTGTTRFGCDSAQDAGDRSAYVFTVTGDATGTVQCSPKGTGERSMLSTLSHPPTAIGLSGTVFIFIRTSLHDAAWLRRFAAAIGELPEIVECHRLAGTIDYLIKCVVRDIDHYDELYKRLILRVPGLVDISASFSMERLKQVTKVDCTTAR